MKSDKVVPFRDIVIDFSNHDVLECTNKLKIVYMPEYKVSKLWHDYYIFEYPVIKS